MRAFVRLLLAAGLLPGLPAAAQHAAEAPAFAAAAGDVRKFQLASGLTLEPWAAEPQLANPVAFSLAPAGTNGVAAYVAETHRMGVSVLDITQNTPWLLHDLSFRTVADRAAFLAGTAFATNTALLTRDSEILRRVADTDGDARADRSDVFADGFNSPVDGLAAGVLVQGTNVWFANIPNLWRFPMSDVRFPTPTNASAASAHRPSPIAQRQLLATGFGVHIGVNGHDLHGLIRGPDGRLYMSFGDRGVSVTNREGVVIHLPDTGGVLRCEPDGAALEVFCLGLRNPQELAFDDLGNLFTVDNDTAGADPCRVLHLVEGGDYGWRASYQHMRGFGPWVQEGLWAGGLDGVLPPAGTVSQGPSGLAYHPGTGFGRYAGKFLHADFPGGVWAFSVKPHGASFAVADREKVLWNAWPTDVEFGPDGALYVLDWVAGWTTPGKGRIHRITENAETGSQKSEVESREVYRLLAEGMTHRPEKELLELLGHADRRVRLEAQWELGGRGTNVFNALVDVALKKSNPRRLQRIHALWAIGQIERAARLDFSNPLHDLIPLLSDADGEVVGQAVRVLSEARLLELAVHLERLTQHPSWRVRAETGLGQARLSLAGPLRHYHPVHGMFAEMTRRAVTRLRLLVGAGRPAYPQQAAANAVVARSALNSLSTENDEFIKHMVAVAARPDVMSGGDGFAWSPPHPVGAEAAWALVRGARAALVREEPFDPLARGALPRRNSSVWQTYARMEGQAELAREVLRQGAADASPLLALEAARAINDVAVPEAYPALAAQLGEYGGALASGVPSSASRRTASSDPSQHQPGDEVPGATPDTARGTRALPEPPWFRIPELTLAAYLEKSGTPWTGPLPLPTNVATLRQQFLKRALNA
ncbi:MAG: PQQ-dependent sugar dehydrogenase, partial [Limisphaerales bacterium]